MRKPLLVTFLLGVVGLGGGALNGCTSLLGDFTVSATSGEGGADGGGEGGACTVCNGTCVDLTSSNTNCGACSNVCNNGQTCQASSCSCPTGKAFCGNACVVASRKQCGPACSECQTDELCGTTCVTAPAPEIVTTPLTPTGWVDGSGKPIAITVKPVNVPGTIYECRTGPVSKYSATVPEWKPCDGAAGTGTTHTPTPDAAVPEGTYRTEYRYRSDTYRSPAASFTFYVHHSLDSVKLCGPTNGGPKFSDDQYFTAANLFNDGEFPLAPNTFPAIPATPARTDPIFLENPWIHIPFTAIRWSQGIARSPGGWPANGANYDFNERSLRHKFVMNPLRSMVLMKRQYQSHARDCKNKIRIGSDMSGDFGPQAFGRGWKVLDCEAFVLNSHGNALCMGSAAGKPVVLEVDKRPGYTATNFAAFPAVAPPNQFSLVTPTVGSAVVPVTYGLSAVNIGNLGGWLAEIPGGSGAWYTIQSVSGLNLTLTVPYGSIPKNPRNHSAFPASPSGVGVQWKINGPPPIQSKFVIPAGMAKLHDDGHNAAAGTRPGPLAGIIAPSLRTKCEVLGCNAGKPWLTYLPP